MASSTAPEQSGTEDQAPRMTNVKGALRAGLVHFGVLWNSPTEMRLIGQNHINCVLSEHDENQGLSPEFWVYDFRGRRYVLWEVVCHVCEKLTDTAELTRPSAERAVRRASRALRSKDNSFRCGKGLIVCRKCFKQYRESSKSQLVNKVKRGEVCAELSMTVTIISGNGFPSPQVKRTAQYDMGDINNVKEEIEHDLFAMALADWVVKKPPADDSEHSEDW